jgi:3'-phosphoadenosine 5'-phosphosulfate sulfotransferase (PAPS reductase)/FAD synthetase
MTPIELTTLDSEQVARLTKGQREERVLHLVHQSQAILTAAIEQHVQSDGRRLAATVLLFSGGNDSTVLAHMFRSVATHAAHANTTIGIEQTREFVRRTCQEWGLPLLERMPPREADRYPALVREQGFPGPGHHFKMYQRLKERALEQVRRELVGNPYRERIVFLAGRRRSESQRRQRVPASERRGSTVWVSPLVNWTKMDLTTYRLLMGDVPVNEVSDLVHMSGECCCGSFAKDGEREELAFWFPDLITQIEDLERELADRDDIPVHRRTWGWGARMREGVERSTVGPLCSSCTLD